MKKLFSIFSKSGRSVDSVSLLSKVEDVARAISFLVLLLDTIRFFQAGLKLFNNDKSNEETPLAPVATGGAAAAADSSEAE